MGGGGKAAEREAREAREAEKKRQDRIDFGTKTIRASFGRNFDTPYYDKLQETGLGSYKDSFENQYADSLKQLQSALARTGMSASSTAARRMTDLEKKKGLQWMDVQDRVRDTVTDRKRSVADAEMLSLQQLQASADPSAAAAQAASQIAINSAPQRWSPLGQVFTDATAGLATQADLERQGTNRYNAGVSNWGNNVRRYVTNVGG